MSTFKIASLLAGAVLALSAVESASAQNGASGRNAPDPGTDSTSRSATPGSPTGVQGNPVTPQSSGVGGAARPGTDLGRRPEGSGGPPEPIQPMTDETKNSANPERSDR